MRKPWGTRVLESQSKYFLIFQTQKELLYEILLFKALVRALNLSSLCNILMLEGSSSDSVLRIIAVPQTEAVCSLMCKKFSYPLVVGWCYGVLEASTAKHVGFVAPVGEQGELWQCFHRVGRRLFGVGRWLRRWRDGGPRPPVQFKINPTGAVFAELMCPADTDSGGEPPASVEKDYFKCHN